MLRTPWRGISGVARKRRQTSLQSWIEPSIQSAKVRIGGRWQRATPDGSFFGGFFSIIYSEQEGVIIIWAVAHGSRRPEYWTRRLK
jgi:hypothetical protein